jgi:hypothetical protein
VRASNPSRKAVLENGDYYVKTPTQHWEVSYYTKALDHLNDVLKARTESCIALYPTTNKNGSWVLYNLTTKSCVRRSQWKKLPTSQLIVDIMNELAGLTEVTIADIPPERADPHEDVPMMAVHDPTGPGDVMVLDLPEDMALKEQESPTGVPDLVNNDDEDSDRELGDSVEDQEINDDAAGTAREAAYNEETDAEEKVEKMMQPGLRRSTRPTAGTRKYDKHYEWNMMNLSVGEAIRTFGYAASKACKGEL